jgi:hypothetical protein
MTEKVATGSPFQHSFINQDRFIPRLYNGTTRVGGLIDASRVSMENNEPDIVDRINTWTNVGFSSLRGWRGDRD